MAQHTGGEWHTDAGQVLTVEPDCGNCPRWDFQNIDIYAGEKLVAVVSMSQSPRPGVTRVTDAEEAIANARLVAAAPAMLAALRELAHDDDDVCICPACRFGKPAIFAATGERP